MRALLFFMLYVLLSGLALPAIATEQHSPLLSEAIALRDAYSEQDVKTVLQRLHYANLKVFGLPCEDVYCQGNEPHVYAATLDALLAELAAAILRWPALAAEIGRTVLSWQYCDVRYRNRSRDLVFRQQQIERQPASGPSPVANRGWLRWGFEEQDEADRLIPYPMQHHGLSGNAKADFLHHYTRRHCFPDPASGHTPYDPTEPMYSGPTHDFPEPSGAAYPYTEQWNASTLPAPTATEQPSPPRPAKPEAGTITPESPTPPPATNLHANALHSSIPAKHHRKDVQTSDSKPIKRIPEAVVAGGNDATIEIPEAEPSSNVISSPTASAKKLQGDVYLRWKMNNPQLNIGINGTWNPFSYFYLRGDISLPFPSRNSNPAYTWGFGYNDWHPGGWAVEFNQWNLQQLGRGGTIQNAEFNLAYRIPFPESWQPYINGTLNARMFGKTPNLGGDWQFQYGSYFTRFGIKKDLRGNNGWQWTYGFGCRDWKAGSFNVEYNNWGMNAAFKPNFRRNGEILLAYHWDY